MISIVLYGRNDNYGYNLHKRAALSLNCMAEVLTDPDDEILFVDYNTPDDCPTFPEAIQDTLTERAKGMLRILRVRPHIHRRFEKKTHLLALEPVSRNVAVRRSNPANRWILSTNTDMLFVPRSRASLSTLVKDLPGGFYHIPRFEIPETLWETFDRTDPVKIIESISIWGRAAHLNEIVFGAPTIKYDAPGDFQLIERDDLFRIKGFDETMVLGWHVDSNMAMRLHLIYGEVGDLVDKVFGYHCDHTRQVTPMHGANRVENSLDEFVHGVVMSEKTIQAEKWGCAGDEIEEIRLSHTRNICYLDAIKAVIKNEMASPTYARYTQESYDSVTYDARHVLPFLADIFVNAAPGTKIAWVGGSREMFMAFSSFWDEMQFGGELQVERTFAGKLRGEEILSARVADLDYLLREGDAFVFDFALNDSKSTALSGYPFTKQSGSEYLSIRSMFLDVVAEERRRLVAGQPLRRLVCINAIHNCFEDLVRSTVGVARTPFSSRIRQGFILPPKAEPRINLWLDFILFLLLKPLAESLCTIGRAFGYDRVHEAGVRLWNYRYDRTIDRDLRWRTLDWRRPR
jgi:hypothetical protein